MSVVVPCETNIVHVEGGMTEDNNIVTTRELCLAFAFWASLAIVGSLVFHYASTFGGGGNAIPELVKSYMLGGRT